MILITHYSSQQVKNGILWIFTKTHKSSRVPCTKSIASKRLIFLLLKTRHSPGILILFSKENYCNMFCRLVSCLQRCIRKHNLTGEARRNDKMWGYKSKCNIVQLSSYKQLEKSGWQIGWIKKERIHSIERSLLKVKTFFVTMYFREDFPWKDSLSS